MQRHYGEDNENEVIALITPQCYINAIDAHLTIKRVKENDVCRTPNLAIFFRGSNRSSRVITNSLQSFGLLLPVASFVQKLAIHR